MLNGIVDSQKVRAQKAMASSQSTGGGGGSRFVPHRSKDRQEIEKFKEALRQQDEAMRQHDDFYASAFAQQQAILQVSGLNYFIHY
jgi:hypothetical protein